MDVIQPYKKVRPILETMNLVLQMSCVHAFFLDSIQNLTKPNKIRLWRLKKGASNLKEGVFKVSKGVPDLTEG